MEAIIGRFIVWFLMVFFLTSYVNSSFESSRNHQEVIMGFIMLFSFCVVNIETTVKHIGKIMRVLFSSKIRAKEMELDRETFLYELWKKEKTLTMEEEVYLKSQIKRRIENMKLDDIQTAKFREQQGIMKSGTLKQLVDLKKELDELEEMAR